MNFVGTVVMIGWIPVVILLFMSQPYRRAVLYAYLAAWLFLPPRMVYFLPGLPDYTKMSATTMGVLLATAIFDMDRLVRFRPRWFDLPMVLWCIAPMFSSITNGLGAYDGASESFALVISWGAPYLVGRLYFNSFEGVREAAVFGWFDADGIERIGAAVIPTRPLDQAGAEQLVAGARAAALEALGPYKVPADILVLEELPRVAQGKPDKPRLRQLFAERAGAVRRPMEEA